jgi:hypothetical protein
MQLVAYGAQDIYLTGNPQITFFKVVYRRHTNFSMEAIPQIFDGTFSLGSTVSCTVPRNGDLVHRMYVKVATGAIDRHTDMRSLLKSVELEIGGQKIDKLYWRWQLAWQNLTYSKCQQNALDVIARCADAAAASGDYLYLPLDFYFCRNAGLALPLIALQYHEVKVRIELNTAGAGTSGKIMDNADATATPTVNISSGELLVDYVYLDTDERRRFAQVSHEYLIEQVQFTGAETVTVNSTNKVDLHFNHPVKELVWVYNATCSSASASPSYVSAAKLQLNGHDRFKEETGDYFLHVQRFQHHTGTKGQVARATEQGATDTPANIVAESGIYSYSFALKPEEHQPSGTCNFSRIDNAVLNLTVSGAATEVYVFAHSYNVLRVMSGMGGLAYSN